VRRAVAILLAAGASERMGRTKPLVPWGGRPLIAHQLAEIQRSRLAECVVVLGREAASVEPWVRSPLRFGWKARSVVNPRPGEGRSASIRAGLTALGAPPGAILIASVDQPLRRDLIDALLAAGGAEWDRAAVGRPADGAVAVDSGVRRTIVVPAFQGRRGHPPLFHGALMGELLGVSEAGEGLRQVMLRLPERVLEMPWQHDDILLNLNTPLDLTPPSAGGPPEMPAR
jgi:molybdenum cofactor cytidylyltransferase